jgi:hypothetical protein
MNVYIVKSFGPQNGYMNLKAFDSVEKAEAYAEVISNQIPPDVEDEFVEVEEFCLDTVEVE